MQTLRNFTLATCVLIAGFVPSSHAATEQAQDNSRQLVASLNWIKSGNVPVAGTAQFSVPDGYVFLNPADTAKLMEAMQNPSNGKEYFFAPDGMPWFAVLEYEPVGYVKDDEKIDPDPLLESIRRGTEASNEQRKKRGWATMSIVGWKFPPRYDNEARRLEWAVDGRSEGVSVVNYNTRVLGRHGVTSVTLVSGPEHLDQAVEQFKTAIRNFKYVDGERYDEYKQGDKIAQYGLAALVTGGAAAVAVKSGAAKWLWKLIVGGGVALIAGIKSLLGRNS